MVKAQSERLAILEAAIMEEVNYGDLLEDALELEREEMSDHKNLGE